LTHTGWSVSRGAQAALPSQVIEAVASFSVNGYAIAGAGGSVYVTRDAGASWSGMRMPSNTPMHGIDMTPNGKGWVGGDGGMIYTTNDFGLNWRPQNSTLNSGIFAIDAFDDKRAYAVGQWGKIMTTGDGGATWVTAFSNASDNYRAVRFANLTHGYVAGNAGKLTMTKNGGQTWTEKVVGTATINGIDFLDPMNGALVAANGDIFTTADGGATWAQRSSGFAGFIYGIDVVNATHAFAVGAGGRFFTSTDSWVTWTFKNAGAQDLHGVSFPTSTSGLLGGAASSLQKTDDAGATFAPMSIAAGPTLNVISSVDANVSYVFGDAATALKTADGGDTWSKLTLPNALNCLASSFLDGSRGWVAQSSNHVVNTSDGGATWTDRTLTVTFNSIHFFTAQSGIAVTTTGLVYKTADGGANWAQNATGLPSNPFGMHWVDSSTGFVGGTGAILKTVDGGTTWAAVTHNLTATHNVRGLAAVKGTTNMVAVGTRSGLGFSYTSFDSGSSFADSSPAGAPQSWGVAGPSDKAVFFSGDSGQIYRSNDKGVTWGLQNSTVTHNMRGGVRFVDENLGFSAGQYGLILRTKNGGVQDKTPPTITSTSPASGAIDVPTTSTVSVTFSERMEQPSAESAWRIGPFITGTFTWSGNTMTWKGDSQFAELTNYEVKIQTDARDEDGNPLAAEYRFNFTTKKSIPPVAPTATFNSPPNGAVNVATNVKVQVTWSAPMNASSVEGAWSITPAAAGAFNWSADTKSFAWQASPVLQEGTKYDVKIGPSAKDWNGNASGATFSLTFTTLSTNVPPRVLSTTPPDNATNVAKDTDVVVKFDRKMRPADTELAFRFMPPMAQSTATWNSPDDDEITWKHPYPLQQDTRYSVTITTDAKDANGVKLPKIYTFNFTTVKDPDFEPPALNCLTPLWKPGDNVPEVDGTSVTVAMNFTDAMDQASVEAAISISPQATIGAKNWDVRKPQEPRLLFPVTGLLPGTEYKVSISAAAKDDAGNPLSADAKCPFRTKGAPPNQTPGGVDPLILGIVGIVAVAAIGGIVGVLFMRAKKRSQEEAERPRGWWEKGGPGLGQPGGPGTGPEPVMPTQYQESEAYRDPYTQEGVGEGAMQQSYHQERMPVQERAWHEPRRQEQPAPPPDAGPAPEGWGFPGEHGGEGSGGAGAGALDTPGGCRNCGTPAEPGDKFCQKCGTAL
jgi:photosystem II stability/assembly factor-like uncharacterized protein